MQETAAVAFATFFATVGPIDIAAIFAALTANNTPAERRSMAIRGTAIATGILLAFALVGEIVLEHLGISLAAIQTAGGILFLLVGIDMVFARDSGGRSTTEEETNEARLKHDIAVFPLATPLIAGPATMGAVVLLIANAESNVGIQLIVIGMLLAVLSVTFVALLGATQLQKLLGVTGLHVISRVFGVLLCALAVQFIFDGIRESGLLSTAGAV